jgi:hypothetical protein
MNCDGPKDEPCIPYEEPIESANKIGDHASTTPCKKMLTDSVTGINLSLLADYSAHEMLGKENVF